jgi:DeoR/GlpR family transcriptional regulator of sugar metabolism
MNWKSLANYEREERVASELAKGAYLSQSGLAKQLGTTDNTLRKTLRKMASKGLIREIRFGNTYTYRVENEARTNE